MYFKSSFKSQILKESVDILPYMVEYAETLILTQNSVGVITNTTLNTYI